jgi:hypothetical protein
LGKKSISLILRNNMQCAKTPSFETGFTNCRLRGNGSSAEPTAEERQTGFLNARARSSAPRVMRALMLDKDLEEIFGFRKDATEHLHSGSRNRADGRGSWSA